MIVENILREKGNAVYTIPVTAKIADAIKLLNAENIGAAVVTEPDGSLAGIVSERDVIRNMHSDAAAVILLPVSRCMTRDLVTCTPGTAIDELMQIMTDRRIRHVPVISNGRLAGLVSIGDVVKRKIAVSEEEAAALRDYIAS